MVRGGKLLSLGQKTKMGSCDKLWKGIKLENNANLFMAGVTVEDAQYVVNPVQNAWLWLENCDFNNNYIGLYAPELPFYTIEHYLWSNNFRADRPLKSMYAGQSPAIPQGGWGYAGIWVVSNMVPMLVGGSYADPSVFEGLLIGIYLDDFTDLTVFGTQFKNLNKSTYPNFPGLTIGISAGTVWGSPVVSIVWLDNCGDGLQEEGSERENVTLTKGYKIFPNPTHNVVTLIFSGAPDAARTAEVFDVFGARVIWREIPQFVGEETIDLSRFGNGVYWLVVREKGKTVFESKIAKF